MKHENAMRLLALVDYNICDKIYMPLRRAIKIDNPAVVNALIKFGANKDDLGKDAETPLIYAITCQSEKSVVALLANNCDAIFVATSGTALSHAHDCLKVMPGSVTAQKIFALIQDAAHAQTESMFSVSAQIQCEVTPAGDSAKSLDL